MLISMVCVQGEAGASARSSVLLESIQSLVLQRFVQGVFVVFSEYLTAAASLSVCVLHVPLHLYLRHVGFPVSVRSVILQSLLYDSKIAWNV